MNVQSKKTNVSLPKLAIKSDLKSRLGIIPNIKMQSKLGQSIETKSHNKSVPKNTPTTAMASCDIPAGVGKKRKTIIITIARIMIAIFAYMLSIFFFCGMLTLFYITNAKILSFFVKCLNFAIPNQNFEHFNIFQICLPFTFIVFFLRFLVDLYFHPLFCQNQNFHFLLQHPNCHRPQHFQKNST